MQNKLLVPVQSHARRTGLKLLVCRHPCAPPRSRDAPGAATVHGLIDNREPRPLGVPRWANARAESPPRRNASCPTKVHDSRPGLLPAERPPTITTDQAQIPGRVAITAWYEWRSLAPLCRIFEPAGGNLSPADFTPSYPSTSPSSLSSSTHPHFIFIDVYRSSRLAPANTPLVSLDPGTTARMCQNVCYST